MEPVFRRVPKDVQGLSLVEYVLLGSFLGLSVLSLMPLISANAGELVARIQADLAAR